MNAAYNSLASMIGKNEADAAIQDYLTTGGQNLDPTTTAWCAAAVNAALGQAGMEGTGSNMARSFMEWGEPVEQPQPGDIAVFSRGDPNGPFGHVGFFEGYNEDGSIRVLGGNQGDAVTRDSYSKDRLLGFRRAPGSGAPRPQGNALASIPMQPQAPVQNQIAQVFQPKSLAMDPAMFQQRRNALSFIPYS